jgi:lipid-A-disaccharide synthase
MIIAGEASGDIHAARLIEALKQTGKPFTFSGLGGKHMAAQGVHIYEDLTRLAVVGFLEVIRHYPEIRKIFHLLLDKIREHRPDAIILVDYPGFNLRLAKAIKQKCHPGTKIIYYISPQVWAWKANRVEIIRKYIDRMLVLFPFEKEFYARYGIEVDFVGHPLLDALQPYHALTQNSPNITEDLTIGLLPGSRRKEIELLFPIMLKAACLLYQENRRLRFILVKAPSVSQGWITPYLNNKNDNLPLSVVEQDTYRTILGCDICMVASGTATLEVALLNKPMVIVYKTSLLTWLLAKRFIKIPHIGLVNIVAGRKIVPECLQYQATGPILAKTLKDMCAPQKMQVIKGELHQLKERLGPPGASQCAAKVICELVNC